MVFLLPDRLIKAVFVVTETGKKDEIQIVINLRGTVVPDGVFR